MTLRLKKLKRERLSDFWGKLSKVTFEFLRSDGVWEKQVREVYDHGNGAAILLYNPETNKVILIKQLRIATFLNTHEDGMILEVPAGLLGQQDPVSCVRKEVLEETGYQISDVQKIYEAYMTPGSVTEMDHLFVAKYSDKMKVSEGGGRSEEQEDIEVLEMDFRQACSMLEAGEIQDAKTIILLQWAKIHEVLQA